MYKTEALNVEQVSSMLGLSRNTVYKMAREGSLPSYRIGRKLRFPQSGIQAMTQGGFAHQNMQASSANGNIAAGQTAHPASFDISAENSLQNAAAFLARAHEAQFTLGGEDIIASTIAHHLCSVETITKVQPMTSYAALVNLYVGSIDAAFVNLYDFRTNSYNTAFIQRLCPGMSVIAFRLIKRKQGFIVRAGNPRKINSWGSLMRDDLIIAPREKGSGAQVLLDQKLIGMDINLNSVYSHGIPPTTTTGCASHVASGAAHLSMGFKEEMGPVRGLSFVPMQVECLDLVVRKTPETKPLIRTLKQMLGDKPFHNELESLIECDASSCGAITYEC